ncbi:MAG: DUF2126 domain-containing protein [Hyphomonadaceae bacterium]
MRAALHHTTRYRFGKAVALGPHIVRLRPAPFGRTPIEHYSLSISPTTHTLHWQHDPHGNWMARIVFAEKTDHFEINVEAAIDCTARNPFDFFVEPFAEFYPFAYPADLAKSLAPYLELETGGARIEAFVASLDYSGQGIVDALVSLNQRVCADIAYQVRMNPGVQTPDETLEQASGSCRDSAWLLVQVLRRLGMAARFTSGYLAQLRADESAEKDRADLHAWAEAYLPGAGWIGFDPTSGMLTAEGHIPLAAAPHYRDAAPVSGTTEPTDTDLSFEMRIERLGAPEEDAPQHGILIKDEDWAALNALAEDIDADLFAQNIRLTMGGEPTFVSMDETEGAEWHIAAMGPTKAARADDLIRRMRARFAPGGLLHYGQGKWYPGESLPRWAYSLYWRKDGEPIWDGTDLIARDAESSATIEDCARLATALCERLGLNEASAQGAFEDPTHWSRQEADLPLNVTPEDSQLGDAEARARMKRVFEGGLDKPIGYVLPLLRKEEGWISEIWRLRRGAIFVSAGDSPLGHRLPLGALPALTPEEYPFIASNDPALQESPLPPAREIRAPRGGKPKAGPVRTAMTIEPREGKVCVFLPPVGRLTHYLELIEAIETQARTLKLAVRLEGYPPPTDKRVQMLAVTPDPGVVEINVHPAATWAECAAITEGLYEDARAARLRPDKYLFDGGHLGSGGGNHIVFGAAAPDDSPFLRRPDLMKSVLIYWQRHPALSYLFSGQFVGPTSQAPRIDEARHEALYELEIALNAIPKPNDGEAPAPWLVDRLLRNLLVDMTGNTHRAEICIDKLYSPTGAMGRLGLVEFRAFETAPDARMSLARQALLRALIAWFWRTPQEGALVRWGTALGDRFMLPHFIWADFLDVLGDLARAGYAFAPAWFEAERAFRFPLFGETNVDGVRLQLRQALEPWHVLGEESEGGGTSRAVDASLARVEVCADGFNPARHAIACNGRRVPMNATGRKEQFVGGVRFKAAMLQRSLHPTVPIHAPLEFQLIDSWAQRALGGFRYHAGKPDGGLYPSRPSDPHEAEARRKARFIAIAATQAPALAPPEEPNADYPLTLDLRRAPLR